MSNGNSEGSLNPCVASIDAPAPAVDSTSQNGGVKQEVNSPGQHASSGSNYAGTAPAVKRPPLPTKVFFAPQKYGFFTMNKVEQRWRDDPEKDKKSQADDIIANVTEKFFPGQKRTAEKAGMPAGPPFMPAPPAIGGMPGIPPPPFMIPPPVVAPPPVPPAAKDNNKRIKFNDEDSDENELFSKLLYKKLNTIHSRKRLEILHVSIMEMVRQAQEEDEKERGVASSG